MIKKYILDLLFPKYCLGCGAEGFFVCAKCHERISINRNSNCFICGVRTESNKICDNCRNKTRINRFLIASNKEDILLHQIIYEYKYRFIEELSKDLSKTLINYIEIYHETLINNNNIIFVPVPLHKKRLYWRGFNQSELLAKEIAKLINIPTPRLLLARIKHTKPQAETNNWQARKNNVESAFCLSDTPEKNQARGKIIVLIDDICTTGATLEECAKVLKQLEPKEIWALVLSRG